MQPFSGSIPWNKRLPPPRAGAWSASMRRIFSSPRSWASCSPFSPSSSRSGVGGMMRSAWRLPRPAWAFASCRRRRAFLSTRSGSAGPSCAYPRSCWGRVMARCPFCPPIGGRSIRFCLSPGVSGASSLRSWERWPWDSWATRAQPHDGLKPGVESRGNIAAALSAMLIVGWWGNASVFYAVAVVSVLASASVLLIRPEEINEQRALRHCRRRETRGKTCAVLGAVQGPPRRILFAATALFHFANAPVMPLVGLYVARLGGTDRQVAAVVLVAQTVMIPVALASGWPVPLRR